MSTSAEVIRHLQIPEYKSGMSIGDIGYFGGNAPDGYVLCDATEVAAARYPLADAKGCFNKEAGLPITGGMVAAYGGGRIVAFLQSQSASGCFYISDDEGVTWKQYENLLSNIGDIWEMKYLNGRFFACTYSPDGAYARAQIWHSVNGYDWTKITLTDNTSGEIYALSIAFGNGHYVVTGDSGDGNCFVWTSDDLITWDEEILENDGGGFNVVWAAALQKFILITGGWCVYHNDSDLSGWTKVESEEIEEGNSVGGTLLYWSESLETLFAGNYKTEDLESWESSGINGETRTLFDYGHATRALALIVGTVTAHELTDGTEVSDAHEFGTNTFFNNYKHVGYVRTANKFLLFYWYNAFPYANGVYGVATADPVVADNWSNETTNIPEYTKATTPNIVDNETQEYCAMRVTE